MRSFMTEQLSAKNAVRRLQSLMVFAKIADINLNARANSVRNAVRKDKTLEMMTYGIADI